MVADETRERLRSLFEEQAKADGKLAIITSATGRSRHRAEWPRAAEPAAMSGSRIPESDNTPVVARLLSIT
jgi:hypothetical protein